MGKILECCNDSEKYVSCMYNSTDKESGMLVFHGMEGMCLKGDETYRFQMNWNRDDVDRLIVDHRSLVKNLSELAEIASKHEGEKIENYIKDESLKNTWNTYLKDFTGDAAPTEEIMRIEEKKDSIGIADEIRSRLENGEELTEDEQILYKECKDIMLTEEEKHIMERYQIARIAEAEKRTGKSKFSYNALIYPKRIFTLMKLGAPEVVIKNEIVQLIIVTALHRFCDSCEKV